MPRLLSVNVGRPQQLSVRRGRPLMSAIGKAPVEGPVRVEGVNVAGDDQADRRPEAYGRAADVAAALGFGG